MRIEVLCTGDELLTGLTTDTNSPYFMGKLFALGEQVRRSTTVGDVREEIEEALRTLSARADVVLVSGGLGPTADDLTAGCAAAVAGVELVEDAAALESMRTRFARRGLAFTENNRRQAEVPAGAEVVPNPVGSAPMFILRIERATLYFVPGVPREYRHFVDHEVLTRIARRLETEPSRTFRRARLLRTVGLAESHLDARVKPLAARHPALTFGFRTHAPENHLKLLAEGRSQAEADLALVAAEAEVRQILGLHVFGQDDDGFGSVVGALLATRGETVALAESCTGGRIADLLTAASGASAYFLGGAVVYANEMKERWVGVQHETLLAHGAVSEPVAREMAEGALVVAKTTWAVSVTGIAGPTGGTPDKPVGTVFVALAGPDDTVCRRHQFLGDREQIRAWSAYAGLELLRRTILGNGA